MHDPTATPVTVVPLTVQVKGVRLVRLTARPELAVALAVPVLPTVTLGALPKLIVWLTNWMPVPMRPMRVGLEAALETMLSVPARVPDAVGVKLTVMVQVAAAAMGAAVQLLLCPKSPLTAILPMLRLAVPALVMVKVWVALVVPMN